MGSVGYSREIEHNLTYELLLTLLEHQFSSPVQWITIQDSLLETKHVQRCVEIGPSDTLKSMFQKTFAQKLDNGNNIHDAPECLTFEDELEWLRKPSNSEHVEDSTFPPKDFDNDVSQTVATEVVKTEETSAPAAPVNDNVIVLKPKLHKPAEIEDAPPTAIEALLLILASGLRTARDNIDTSQSIKFLAKGRSAVQNEIIGNLVMEFGSLPDGVEETALSDLDKELSKSFRGKVGPYIKEWLGKKLSEKLAPSINVSKVRSHLKGSYGMKEGHQDSFLITADFDEITSRLATEQESWNTINRWVTQYLQKRGLEHLLSQAGNEAATHSSVSQETTSSPQLAKFGKDLANLMAKHFNNSLGVGGGHELEPKSENLKGMVESLQNDVEQLSKELGTEFVSGIRPSFRREMVYKYRSAWNWAVQDLYVTLSKILTRADKGDDGQELLDWIEGEGDRLRNRITDRMRRCAEYIREKWERSPEAQEYEHCLVFLRRVLRTDSTIIPDDGGVSYEDVSFNEEPIGVTGNTIPEVNSFSELEVSASSGSDVKRSNTETPSSGLIVHHPLKVCTMDQNGTWETNIELTNKLRESEERIASSNVCPVTGTVLIIGAGRQSISFVLVSQLLGAGCRVALCTSRLTPATRRLYSQVYAQVAKPGAELVLLPFNQGSVQDTLNLINYINNDLGWEIDHLVPFAAIQEIGRTLEDLDSTSELAHRIMLTNTLRLIGSIVSSKRQRRVLNHSTQVVLPLSPNHGQMGGDGLYAESKLALEALMNKWFSESWSDAISICAVRIGWTRGTGLMVSNDQFAAEVEKCGLRTFSAHEMAALLLVTMADELLEACNFQPILCDFSGGMKKVTDLADRMNATRSLLETKISVQKRLKEEVERDRPPTFRGSTTIDEPVTPQEQRAKLRYEFPNLPKRYEEVVAGTALDLNGLIDLDSTVVITGFAEIGAAGSSRTRWELEAHGSFSLEGCVELAWMMGMIRYDGNGWVETESGSSIRDIEVKSKFEGRIVEHTGIRLLDPDQSANSNSKFRDMLHEVGTEEDLPPFECSPQTAQDFKARHGDAVEILSNDGTTATVCIRRGASIFIPKSLNSEYFVGAQIPTGWDPARYGIPAEVITQVERPSLYALVCAAEAFLSAGLTDVYELYRYIHVSELGNCIGSGAGGTTAARTIFQTGFLGRECRKDILSEAFTGTAAAWVNLLLLSASGPLRTPAGTCATSLESLGTAYELVNSGKVKVALAGGYDVFTRPMHYEFGEMKAIINSAQDSLCGREPREMSRPFTSTRNGFVLGDGIGVQVVTSASLAIEMGLPIYGVVAMHHMAADKLGRSIPAPGQGILTAAKQTTKMGIPSMLMDPKLRAKRIRTSLGHIDRQAEADIDIVKMEAAYIDALESGVATEVETQARIDSIKQARDFEKKAMLRELGNNYWVNNPGISPIEGGLSVFGLTVNDITFASLHGTATKMNDVNECATLDLQMRHLGRHLGNPLFTIAQKSIVGHGVGASGAWAVNGALQAMHSGIIPGNRNADDIDERLQGFERLLLINENVNLGPSAMKACSVTSFGFGQKGAQVLLVHPRYLFSAISKEEYQVYCRKQMARGRLASRELDRGLHGEGMVKAKEDAPYTTAEGNAFLLDPLARIET